MRVEKRPTKGRATALCTPKKVKMKALELYRLVYRTQNISTIEWMDYAITCPFSAEGWLQLARKWLQMEAKLKDVETFGPHQYSKAVRE